MSNHDKLQQFNCIWSDMEFSTCHVGDQEIFDFGVGMLNSVQELNTQMQSTCYIHVVIVHGLPSQRVIYTTPVFISAKLQPQIFSHHPG